MIDQIKALHAAYVLATGIDIRLAFDRERVWYEFIGHGFTESDVALVGRFLALAVKKGERNPGCLKFHNLIEQPGLFEEELSLIKATMRNFKPPATVKEQTIKAFSPVVVEVTNHPEPRPAKEVIEALVEGLRKAAS